jgi:hypothetical protein
LSQSFVEIDDLLFIGLSGGLGDLFGGRFFPTQYTRQGGTAT